MAQKLYEEILTNVPGAIIETHIGAEGEKMFLFRDLQPIDKVYHTFEKYVTFIVAIKLKHSS